MNLFKVAYLHEPFKELGVGEFCVSENGATGLDGFYNFTRHVTSKGKTRRL
jgi:hypothetical protein